MTTCCRTVKDWIDRNTASLIAWIVILLVLCGVPQISSLCFQLDLCSFIAIKLRERVRPGASPAIRREVWRRCRRDRPPAKSHLPTANAARR